MNAEKSKITHLDNALLMLVMITLRVNKTTYSEHNCYLTPKAEQLLIQHISQLDEVNRITGAYSEK